MASNGLLKRGLTARSIGLLTSLPLLTAGTPVGAQVPDALSGRLEFKLAGADAGHETYRIQRTADGYRVGGDVELRAAGLHVLQRVAVETDARLAFSYATVQASVNGETSEVRLRREGGVGVQEITQADSTISTRSPTPDGSVLLTNNVIHHIVQFAWLHPGAVGDTAEFFAFPRVPVSVVLQSERSIAVGERAAAVRRYYLNLANRLAVYVWLAADGRPLKISVPLQSFVALDSEHRDWEDSLGMRGRTRSVTGGYDGEEVRFRSGEIWLAGTLTLPSGAGRWPAVVLISGSGPQDRDENTPGSGGLKLGVFRSVADTLTGRGIAVLRYDDRGVGGSGGTLATAGLSDLVADVRAAVRYLRGRPEIDGRRLALVGHSEGGIIAPIVAAADTQITAVALMAGTAAPLDSLMIEQVVSGTVAAGGDSADVVRARRAMGELSRAVRQGRDVAETDLPAAYRALGGNRKWLREHMEHDPLATLMAVRAPVLVVNGGQDIQVAPEHAHRLGAALAEAGHRDYEVRIFPRLNHLFAVSRGAGSAEYTDPEARVDPAFLSFLADWLGERLSANLAPNRRN